MTRRSLFALAPLALGFAGGIASGAGLAEVFGGKGRDASGGDGVRDADPVEAGSVAWALWIGDAPEVELLGAAGELERVRLRSRGDRRLTPVFVRLLKVALRSDESTADQAGAIAVRCLDRLGADHLVLVLDRRVRERTDRPATVAEIERVRRRKRERRAR